jgi:hypothetical protein
MPGCLVLCLFLAMAIAALGDEGVVSETESGNMTLQERLIPSARNRLAYLKSELDISEEQIQAWDEYERALADYRIELQRKRQRDVDRLLNGERRPTSSLRDSSARADSHGRAKLALRDAYLRLYGLLGEEQQLMADRLLTRVECGL